MSVNLIPSDHAPSPAPAYPSGHPGGFGAGSDERGGAALFDQLHRFGSAMRRHKWWMLAIIVTGSSVGYALTQTVAPKYDVSATIWISRGGGNAGPITTPGLISNSLAWPDLAKSWIVLDKVVSRLSLHVAPLSGTTLPALRELRPSDQLVPGRYALRVDESGREYTLSRIAEERSVADSLVERGTVGDSVGRSVGFRWQPPAAQLAAGTRAEFEVVTPREAAVRLSSRLVVNLPPNGNLMWLRMSGEDPQLLAATLNMVQTVFIEEAARLKRENLSAVTRTVQEQLDSAKQTLDNARRALESFKVSTITLPSENTPVAPGVTVSTSPVLQSYFQDNVNYKVVQRDREALEQLLAARQNGDGAISIEALMALPSIIQSNPGLNTELQNLATAEAQLRQALMTKTEAHPDVRLLRERIETLHRRTIPALAEASLAQLRSQEADMRRRIDGAATELRAIPQRTMQEASLQLEVQIADRLYTELQARASAARLAELSALPDVAILDPAVAPLRPTSDTTIGIFLVSIAISIGVAVVLVVLLDLLDKRFRYPRQATHELGLDIVGAIPTLTNPRNAAARLQEASQLVESFRSLSLAVRSSFNGDGPVQLTISSPGPGDGKSFISANLASALADGGYRTVLIDGDIRRGALHNVFGLPQAPGLMEYLAGEAVLSEVLRPTAHGYLFVIPGGRRRRHGPELLAGDTMTSLVRLLRDQFDAIIIDSAPLGAGIDPYALGVATGAMLVVLRTGETDRRLAQAKLEVLDRMPVRILGTVLNDIGENPQFKYYYYLEGYGALENTDDQSALIGAGPGAGRE